MHHKEIHVSDRKYRSKDQTGSERIRQDQTGSDRIRQDQTRSQNSEARVFEVRVLKTQDLEDPVRIRQDEKSEV